MLGYDVEEVEHLRLCGDWGLGESDLQRIEVLGMDLGRFTDRVPHQLLGRCHPDVRWVIGRDKACTEGCRGNSECIQEMLYNDHHGRGGWTLICGSGFADADLEKLPGDILVVGPCACSEVRERLEATGDRRRIHWVPEHNDLMSNTRHQARLMGVKPVKMVPLNPLAAALTLFVARLHGLTSRVPPLFG